MYNNKKKKVSIMHVINTWTVTRSCFYCKQLPLWHISVFCCLHIQQLFVQFSCTIIQNSTAYITTLCSLCTH